MPESVSTLELVALALAVLAGLVFVGVLFALYLRWAPDAHDVPPRPGPRSRS